MEEVTMERRVRVIPATKQAEVKSSRRNHKQRVAAYCRVSTDSEEQLNSYEAQKSYYTQKIEENPDWEMAGVFADEGLSGVSMKKRKEFNRMIAACKRGRIDLILTKSVSRFSRNTMECLKTVKTLRDFGVTVIFEKEDIDTSVDAGDTMRDMLSHFAKEECKFLTSNLTYPVSRCPLLPHISDE